MDAVMMMERVIERIIERIGRWLFPEKWAAIDQVREMIKIVDAATEELRTRA